MTDIIDLRDYIERFEALREQLEELTGKDAGDFGSFDGWLEYATEHQASFDLPSIEFDELVEELQKLNELLEELKGNGGDEQFEGEWYPITLINEDYFTDYARELCADYGEIPSELPWYIERHIDWDGVASELKCDYSTVEIEGRTYYYR